MQRLYSYANTPLDSVWHKIRDSPCNHVATGGKTRSRNSSADQHDELGPQYGCFVDRFPIFLDRLLPLRRVVIGEETGSTKAGDSQLSLINQGLRSFDP